MGDGADARGLIVALVGGQPVVTPLAGVGWGGDERLVPQVVERDLGVVGEAVGGRKGDPPRLGQQGLDVEGVLSGNGSRSSAAGTTSAERASGPPVM
jgi:hypothetical protein